MLRGAVGHRLIDGFTMIIVNALSLVLLLYVSYGDSKRTYEQIHIEKITTNGKLVQNSIEKFLRDGLPLKQYAGFATLTAPILEGEDVDVMAVYDQAGHQVFLAVDKSVPKPPGAPGAITKGKREIEVEYGPAHYHVIIPLRTRFETVGSLVVSSNMEVVSKRLRATFHPLLYQACGLAALFAAVLMVAMRYGSRSRIPWLQIGYAMTFLIMSVTVIFALIGLYYDGVQGKTRASVVTLAQRLSDVVEFKLHFKDFDGMARIFSEYTRLNSEISEAALIENDTVQIATDSAKVGKNWVSDPRKFEFQIDLTRADQQSRIVNLVVTVPKDVVFDRVIRSVKNFAALFFASALLAGLFLQVAASLQGFRSSRPLSDNAQRNSPDDASLIIVKPIFFLAVFLDSLTYSFLPNFMQEAARAGGLSIACASIPFTIYYLCFALVLLPAGNLAERYGPKLLILLGMLLASGSVTGMIIPLGLPELTVLRGLAGLGQGMLLIGVQVYVLAVASPHRKTQGIATIVFGFQGGLISGMALGSLLVTYSQAPGVFAVSGAVGLAAILYTWIRLPRTAGQMHTTGGLGAAARQLAQDTQTVITNTEFVKTLLCIGIPAKAILTGTVTFALPLLLVQYGYRSEDIGQIIMLYGLAVIAATGYASRLVDRANNSEHVLFWGAIMSGSGLVLIGLMGSTLVGNGALSTTVLIAGAILVGIAHGFINAPVVTHVAQSELAKRIGVNPVTTSYRFLERAGHIAGPIVVAQAFLIFGQDARVITWIGIAIACLGLLFVAHNARPQIDPLPSEALR